MSREIGYVVTHTHWDREWRYPLWENRMYLVDMMEELLNILDTDNEYTAFLLDGQTVAVEDYLEVRPENYEKIKEYIRTGRINVGPWYTLPDLYPVDGECLVRNLLKGTRLAKKLGGCLNVAYESFGWGQISQFPQIYKGFGIDIVIVSKNVSRERAPESEFIWEGADGTRILATRLGQHARANFFMNSYIEIMNGMEYSSDNYRLIWQNSGQLYHQADSSNYIQDYFMLENTEVIHHDKIRSAAETAWRATDDTTLKSHRVLMNGSDSTTAQPLLTKLIKLLNEQFEDREFIHSTLERYTDKLKELIDYDSLRVLKGELRDGPAHACSANALMTRPYIKIFNKKVENALIRCAEPLSVINAMLGEIYDSNFLNIAEKYLLLSHPHDSINGVTQDKTVHDVMYMLNQSLEIAEVINNRVCSNIIKNIDTSRFDNKDILLVIVNPLPKARRDIIKVYIDTPREMNVWDFDILDSNGVKVECQRVSRKEEIIPVSNLHSRPLPLFADRHCVYMDTGEMPAGGYKVFLISPMEDFNRTTMFWPEMRKSSGGDIVKAVNLMENEYLEVTIENNGTLSIFEKQSGLIYSGLNYFEDTGDCGDYWMYYPPHNNKTYSSLGVQAKIWMEDNGPLSATLASEIKMMLPAYALRPENEVRGESKRSDEEKEMTIKTYFTLKKGSKKIDVRLIVDNSIEDHRLRVMFDTGIQSDYVDTAGHFTVDRRPYKIKQDSQGMFFPEMQTLPMQKFVDISDGLNGFAVLNNCFIEYEAIDNRKGTLAITLLRGVRNIICTEKRSGGYFPNQKGGQSLGIREYEYSLYPHRGEWHQANVYKGAEELNVPLKIIQTKKNKEGKLPLENSFYSVNNDDVVISAFKRSEDRNGYIMRLFNPKTDTFKVAVRLYSIIKEAYLTDLNENRLQELHIREGNFIDVEINGNKIITIEVVI